MIKLINRYINLSILLIVLLTGCAKSSQNSKSPVDEGEDGAIGISESDSVKVKDPDKKVPVSFANSSEAIEFMKNSGHWEKYANGIIPKMAEEELVYATKLLNNEFSRFIIVDKASMNVILYSKYGEVEKKYKMACAKNFGTKHKKADSRTPEGFFSAEGIYDSTDWLFTDDNGVTSQKKGQFGPRFIRLKCPNTSQIGIHGTSAPWSIGNRVSHGCIRITNENILELVELVEIGMPIIVSPGSRDMAVNEYEGYCIPSVTVVPGGSRAVKSNYKPQKKTQEQHTDSLKNDETEMVEGEKTDVSTNEKSLEKEEGKEN